MVRKRQAATPRRRRRPCKHPSATDGTCRGSSPSPGRHSVERSLHSPAPPPAAARCRPMLPAAAHRHRLLALLPRRPRVARPTIAGHTSRRPCHRGCPLGHGTRKGEKGRPSVAAPPPETRPVPTSTDRIERRGGGEATPRNERKLGGVVARSGGSEERCARRVIAASSHGQQHPLLDEADEGRQNSAQWLPRTPNQ